MRLCNVARRRTDEGEVTLIEIPVSDKIAEKQVHRTQFATQHPLHHYSSPEWAEPNHNRSN